MSKADLAYTIAAGLSFIKVATDAFGFSLLTDSDVNDFSNAVAILIIGAYGIYLKVKGRSKKK